MPSFAWPKGLPVRTILPFFSSLVGILAEVAPWPLPYFGPIAPLFALAILYYWTVYRPDLLRPTGVFVLGLLYDLVTGFPLGLSAILFVAMYELTLSQRRFFVNHAFSMLWFGFALVLLLTEGARWFFLGFWNGAFAPLGPVFLQVLFTLAIFPLPARLLIWLQRLFLTQEDL